MAIRLPNQGIVFWPVGNGDSTTLSIDDKTVIQVDINHLEKAEEDDDERVPVLDHLLALLPKNSSRRPYLSVFVLTHPDQDHCRGYRELLKKIDINEVWFTPRVFREYKSDLCDDAKAFKDEAFRRVKVAIKNEGKLVDGDRIRIVGYDDLLKEKEFEGYPSSLLVVPGSRITSINGSPTTAFSAFIHAPFKDDAYGDRNDASLGMHVTLMNGEKNLRTILLGDLAYPTVKRILEKSKADSLSWEVLLAPHHCSKKVMYWKDEGEDEETLRKEIVSSFEDHREKGAYVVASAESTFTDGEGDDPPHAKARRQYEKIVEAGHFLCTQEWPTAKTPGPMVFELTDKGITLLSSDSRPDGEKGSALSAAIAEARGGTAPPQQQVGFGSP